MSSSFHLSLCTIDNLQRFANNLVDRRVVKLLAKSLVDVEDAVRCLGSDDYPSVCAVFTGDGHSVGDDLKIVPPRDAPQFMHKGHDVKVEF